MPRENHRPIAALITYARPMLTGLALVWGGIVNLFLIGNLVRRTLPPVAVSNQLAPWFTLGSVLLTGAALVMRVPLRIVLWLAPGSAAFIRWFVPAWFPKPAPNADGITLTAVTHNILGWGADMEQIIALIREIDADIVAMQEVRDQEDTLFQARLSDVYPHQAAHVAEEDGLVLLSRYPIIEWDTHIVAGRDGRHLRAVIDVTGQPVAVYVMHPPIPARVPWVEHFYEMFFVYDETDIQPHIDYVVKRIQTETLPALLLCDCNSTPRSRQYSALDTMLDEAFGARGWGLGFTHPVQPFPVLRIDYVWYTDQFAALEAKVWPHAGTSDHYPVWAKLVLKTR